MKERTALAAADLYVLLDREFRRRKPACADCFVQLPYRVDVHGTDRANWEVALPPQCANGCAPVLEDLVDEFRDLYDLNQSGGDDRR